MTTTIRHESEVWRLARRQHGLITRTQLLALGYSSGAIRHRLARGRLWRIHPGVYAVGRPILTREGRWLAAVLACGAGAALSRRHAGALWEVWEGSLPRRIQVAVPTDGGRTGPNGIDAWRRSAPFEAVEVAGVPVTSLLQTLVDLGGDLDRRGLRSVVRQSERVHDFDLVAARRALEDVSPHAWRAARLRELLDDLVPGAGDSPLEDAFASLCLRQRIPAPDRQVPVGRFHADFMWRDLWLVVETDGRGSHDGFTAFEDDRVKDRALKAAGLEVIRFTHHEVMRRPRLVADEVRAARKRMAALRRLDPRPPFGAVESLSR